MAARASDTTPPGREKRGTSPLHPLRRKSSVASKTASPATGNQVDPPASNKNVPSYLKATTASGRDTHGKKPATSSSSSSPSGPNKPTLTRRGSFDKPPPSSSSSSPRTRISPNPGERVLRSSSSFSGKTSTFQKPLLDKMSKAAHTTTATTKDVIGKQRASSLYARPVSTKKTTTTTTKKHDTTTSHGTTTKASSTTRTPDIAGTAISESEQSEPEDTQESSPVTHEIESETIISNMVVEPTSETGDHIDSDSTTDVHHEEIDDVNANNISEVEDIKPEVEQSIVLENQELTIIQEPEKLPQLVEEIIHDQEPDQETNHEPVKHDLDHQDKEREEPSINASNENNIQEEKEVENGGKNQENEAVTKEEETQAVQEKVTIVASSSSSAKPQQQVLMHGKKEAVVSNDVIEETASKLREQRKNKVRALAGAFESVISLQETK